MSFISDIDDVFDNSDVMMVSSSSLILSLYRNVISTFCTVYDDVFERNHEIFASSPVSEQHISFDTSVFISSRLCSMFGFIIVNADGFRDMLAETVILEKDIDNLSDSDRKVVRKKLGFDHYNYPYKNAVVPGFSDFSIRSYFDLFKFFVEDYDQFKGSDLNQKVDSYIRRMSVSERDSIGAVLCNYGYLLRAFECNNIFRQDVVKIISKCMEFYRIN